MTIIKTRADESVSNGDLISEEVEETDVSHGSDDRIERSAGNGRERILDESGPGDGALTGVGGGSGPRAALEASIVSSLDVDVGLRTAAEASFDIAPAITPESVIDDDGRRQIANTYAYPWRVHCSLRIIARDGSAWLGTGFFISPRVLATAGHNVFINGRDPDRRGWVRNIEVIPGRDGNELPFGSALSTRFYSVRGWADDANTEFDYGAIVLDPSEALGNSTGWIGFGAYSDATLRSVWANLSGYPSDRGRGREQWYMARRVDSVSARKVFYDIDTFGGQSGSAVYRIKDGSRYAIGIHAYGVGARPLNSATRINRPAFDNLSAWKQAHQ